MRSFVSPKSVIYKSTESISFSDLHFTENNPDHEGKPIYENVSYKLDAKGNLKVNMITLDASNFNVNCQLNKGASFYQQ